MLRTETRTRFELALRVGNDIRLPCRVCFFRAPEEVANRRRQIAKPQAAKKGRRPTQESLALMGWTILLTNIPAAMLSLEQAALLYAVRWQGELIFKLWKSHMKRHRIAGVRQARILVEWYAKRIGLVLFQFLALPLRAKDINLSPTKAFKRVVKHSAAFADAIESLQRLEQVIHHLHTRILKFAAREMRKKRLPTCQQLLVRVDYYA
jgi:IS4 transposase